MFYKLNINTFNFNVEVGGRRFFEISDLKDPSLHSTRAPSQAPGARFLVESYNELTGILTKNCIKNALGYKDKLKLTANGLLRKFHVSNGSLHLLSPWRILNAVFCGSEVTWIR
jgi:hypothetical protein